MSTPRTKRKPRLFYRVMEFLTYTIFRIPALLLSFLIVAPIVVVLALLEALLTAIIEIPKECLTIARDIKEWEQTKERYY